MARRLPIQEHGEQLGLGGGTRLVLNINDVVLSLLRFHATGDWVGALDAAIPARRRRLGQGEGSRRQRRGRAAQAEGGEEEGHGDAGRGEEEARSAEEAGRGDEGEAGTGGALLGDEEAGTGGALLGALSDVESVNPGLEQHL